MFSIGTKRFFKKFFRVVLFLYIIGSFAFIGYMLYSFYLNSDRQEEEKEESSKEEVKDLAEGKIYLNNTQVERLYAYLPNSSEMYNLNDILYKNFDQNILKAKAFELIEKADQKEKDRFILSETTLNAKMNDLYGDFSIKQEGFSYFVNKPLLDSSITSIQCIYNANKYICEKKNTKKKKEDELRYIESATKDEKGSIHIYERYVFFVKNNTGYDLYKDFNKTEKITNITHQQKLEYTIDQYLKEYQTIPTYEHIYKKKGNQYYLYETKVKE